MRNPITTKPSRLVTQMNDAVPGITKYGTLLGLAANLVETFDTEATALNAAINIGEQGKLDVREKRRAVNATMKTCQTFVTIVRELFKPVVGKKYNQAWNVFGFSGSLQIPRNVDDMLEFLAQLSGHLTDHPELLNTEANVNAAHATALRIQLLNGRTALNEAVGDLQRFIEAREAKVDSGRYLLRELLSTLRLKLSPLDSRWVEFGCNKPGALATPPAPEALIAVLIGANAISMRWDAAPRATHYRVWKRVVGVDADWVYVSSPADLDFTIDGLPGNSLVEVAVSASNSTGDSPKSVVVSVQTL